MSRKLSVILTILSIVGLLITACVMAPGAFAASTGTYSFSGKNAEASFWLEQPDGGYQSTYVWGGTLASKTTAAQSKPEKVRGTFGFAYQEQYLPARDDQPETYRLLVATEVPGVFSADNKLTRASLVFRGPAHLMVWYDEMPWECEPAPDDPDLVICPDPDLISDLVVTVSMRWTASGPLERGSYLSRGRTDGLFFIDRYNYQARRAAATGSIVDSNGVVYFEGTFDYGAIFDTKSGGHFKATLPYGVW